MGGIDRFLWVYRRLFHDTSTQSVSLGFFFFFFFGKAVGWRLVVG